VSSALALAGVTAVLRDLLNDGIVNHNVSGMLGSTVVVSAVPPDRVVEANGTENAQINLFLHQVTPNTGWRNEGLPSRDSSGRNRLTNPPLALNLHYLLSAYSSGDLHGEILLGYAMQLLHETPVLSRDAIRTALIPSPEVGATLPPALRALADSGLDRQIEQIRIVPEYLNTEEISKLWTATLSHYRPTAAYQVSVVLIESGQPARSPLPVLTRGRPIPGLDRDEGVFVAPGLVPPYPTLESALTDMHATPSTLQLDDVVKMRGHHLAGTNRAVVLRNDRFRVEQEIAVADGTDEVSFVFNVSNLPADLPVGVYQLELRVLRSGEAEPRTSNPLPVALAPAIIFPPIAMTRGTVNGVPNVLSLSIGCRPEVRVGQKVALLMDTREAPALPFTANTATLDFEFADAPPAGGTPLLRLKVDGIESIVVSRGARPPAFFDHHITLPP
jgi:hypothetical protein